MPYRQGDDVSRCRECQAPGATGCARCAAQVCRVHREDGLCEPCDRELRRLGARPTPIQGPIIGAMLLAAVAAFFSPGASVALMAVAIGWLPYQGMRRMLRRRRFIAGGKGRHLLRERS